MFLSGISPAVHHDLQPGGRSPYDGDDGDRTLVVLLTFGIFFSFVILYLVAGLIWAVVITAAAVVLSFLYLRAARSTGSSGGGGDVAAAAIVSAIPAFEYKRVNGGGGEDGGAAARVGVGAVRDMPWGLCKVRRGGAAAAGVQGTCFHVGVHRRVAELALDLPDSAAPTSSTSLLDPPPAAG
ncbi:hypothetical protein OsJ_17759 [Oryza sativa Japonica Group]|uniref:Uncharacterized protein n=1 Tax=Oryza sativa subsp. japonica TaxID=39947 RepID=B9FNF6_ORYSJ|nr:hypothetical protein OsJ_17759 [Oryza sativa Japonica Group]